MLRILAILFMLLVAQVVLAQNTFSAIIKTEAEEEELLVGAIASIDTYLIASADTNGVVYLQNIPNGEHTIEFSMFGFFKKKLKLKFLNFIRQMRLYYLILVMMLT